jgi:hypothetical protein
MDSKSVAQGSIPCLDAKMKGGVQLLVSAKNKKAKYFCQGIAQSGRVTALDAGGRGFKSYCPDH